MSSRGLTVKQKRFVKAYVRDGNGTRAALEAYETNDPRTAHAIAAENLRKPAIQRAANVLLDGHGLSPDRLLTILAHYLDLHREADPRLKALALKALDMALKLTDAYHGNGRKPLTAEDPLGAEAPLGAEGPRSSSPSAESESEMMALLKTSERILADNAERTTRGTRS